MAVSKSDGVMAGLEAVDRAVRNGLSAAGFVAFEAAGGFDAALVTRPSSSLPLLKFGLFRRCKEILLPLDPDQGGAYSIGPWTPSVTSDVYRQNIERIRNYIAAGDTYQVNYTFGLQAEFSGSPWAFFLHLLRSQVSPYAAYLDFGTTAICSVSPELFFELGGTKLTCRPMKGTADRGLWTDHDHRQRQWLEQSEKNRAENAMIVDMVRNDAGRIARSGSVRVESAFDVERWPTVFQMTSTVTAQTAVGLHDLFRAMFPSASVTGAPKVRTMQIIRELEPNPRGVYTGAVGYVLPNRRAQFNVAIRTVTIDRTLGRADYGVGGGIVWDSTATDEYEECRTKARVLTAFRTEFEFLETLLWEYGIGFFLLDEHLRRLTNSAEYFDFHLNPEEIKNRLRELEATLGPGNYRIRLLTDRMGGVRLESALIPPEPPSRPWRIGLAREPVDPDNPFLYHKTTHRTVYTEARTDAADCDDILLWNPKGQVTETRIANVVVEKGGQRLTPPVECGLLPGTYRNHLLEQGEIQEAVLTVQDVRNAEKIFIINSVRRWQQAQIATGA